MADLRKPLGEVRVVPCDLKPVRHFIRADYAGLEARAMANACEKCPACGANVMKMFMAQHCREKKDDAHLVLEVLES